MNDITIKYPLYKVYPYIYMYLLNIKIQTHLYNNIDNEWIIVHKV